MPLPLLCSPQCYGKTLSETDLNNNASVRVQTVSACEDDSPPQSDINPSTATASSPATTAALLGEQPRAAEAESATGMPDGGKRDGLELRWWLEIVGAGEVGFMF